MINSSGQFDSNTPLSETSLLGSQLLQTRSKSRESIAISRGNSARSSMDELSVQKESQLLNQTEDALSEFSWIAENDLNRFEILNRNSSTKLIFSNKLLERNILNALDDFKDFIVPVECLAYDKIELIEDLFPFLDFRKAALRLKLGLREMSEKIAFSPVFEWFILGVIIVNLVFISIESPDYPASNTTEELDRWFIYIYTLECGLKVVARGIVLDQASYFRDWWNIVDFSIVITSWVDIAGNASMNLKSVRSLRILRPLKGATSIQGVRVLMLSLFLSLKPLINSLLVLFIVISIFAIIGLQLWIGSFKNNCIDINTGIASGICGYQACPIGHECVYTLNNPDFNTLGFDSFFYSWLNVFQIITLEGWSNIMMLTSQNFSDFCVMYYIPLFFIGSLLILNLTVAVLSTSFTAAYFEFSDKRYEKLSVEEIIRRKKEMTVRKTIIPYDNFINSEDNKLGITEGLDIETLRFDGVPGVTKENSFIQPNSIAPTLFIKVSEAYRNEVKRSLYYARVFTLKGDNNKMHKLHLSRNSKISSTSYEDLCITEELSLLNQNEFYKKLCSLQKIPFHTLKQSYPEYTIFQMFYLLSQRTSRKNAFFKLQFSVKSFLANFPEKNLKIGEWSADDICPLNYELSSQSKNKLNKMKFKSHSKYFYVISRCRNICFKLASNKFFSLSMSILVIINITVLSWDHYGISTDSLSVLFIINSVCTWVFLLELLIKLFGYGFKSFSRDYMNILDVFVIVLSLLDFFFAQSTGFNAFRALRVIRLFRAIRVVKIFRYFKFMDELINVVTTSMTKFVYLLIFLLLLQLIFTLLGMEIFGNQFDFPEGLPRNNFDTFHSAFVTIFQVLSTENWDQVLRNCMRSSSGHWSGIFLVIWIVLGNFVVLNLFLGVLLGGFEVSLDKKTEERKNLRPAKEIYESLKNAKGLTYSKEKMFKKIIECESDSEEENYSINQLNRFTMIEPNSNILNNISETSYCFIKDTNRIRRFLINMILNPKFEISIITITILSLITLIWETYIISSSKTSDSELTAQVIDSVFTGIFFIEFMIKSTALGFCLGPKTYIKDHWNKLDFAILVLSLIDASITSINISIIKVLRSLRILRPLKLIRFNSSMKIVLTAVLSSLRSSLNVLGLISIIWLIFGILGVSLFNGKLYRCQNTQILDMNTCLASGYSWVNSTFNYDNIFEAFLTLFLVSTQEDWPGRMYDIVDAFDTERSPIENYNPAAAYFAIFFVFIGDFFLINLFTIVVYSKFTQAKSQESSAASIFLTRKQMDWLEVQKLAVKSVPAFLKNMNSENKIRRWVQKMVHHSVFQGIITGTILVNTLQMAMIYDDSSSSYDYSLMIINDICTYVFVIEAVLKITAVGARHYFKSNWNKFDFFVVASSLSVIVLQDYFNRNINILRYGPQLIRTLRVLRLTRILKVFSSLKYLQDMMNVIWFSMPSAMNLLCLMLIIFMMYSILGVYLFWQVTGSYINDYWNFRNFHKAMLILWRMSTGEDYPNIMADCINYYGNKGVAIYFTSFVAITTFVLMEFFVSVIIQNYNEFIDNPTSAVYIFSNFVKEFKRCWIKYSSEFMGKKIKLESLELILKEIGNEIGVSEKCEKINVKKLAYAMNIYIDNFGHIYYHDLLYAFIKRKYSKIMNGKSEECAEKILKRYEKIVYNKLNEIRKKCTESSKEFPDFLEKNSKVLIQVYYTRCFFNSWKSFYKLKKLKKLQRKTRIIVNSCEP